MNDPVDGAVELGKFLVRHKIDHVVIGGLAVQAWGEARLTRDADLTISSSVEAGVESIVELITGEFESRVPDPVAFARQTRMILIRTSSGIEVDLSLGMPGYEDELFARATDVEFQPGRTLRVCSPEDLIIHKAVAGRAQDEADIESVVIRQDNRLDIVYVRRWLATYSGILEDERIADRFERAWSKYKGASDEG